jgi:hypothetical protein
MANADPSIPAVVLADVRVYNKSPQRSFLHDKLVLAPNSFLTVPAAVANLWLSGYPDTVVEAGVAQKELGGLTSELSAAKARIAELEAAAEKKKPSKKTDEVV